MEKFMIILSLVLGTWYSTFSFRFFILISLFLYRYSYIVIRYSYIVIRYSQGALPFPTSGPQYTGQREFVP
jgi:hypothetical protein